MKSFALFIFAVFAAHVQAKKKCAGIGSVSIIKSHGDLQIVCDCPSGTMVQKMTAGDVPVAYICIDEDDHEYFQEGEHEEEKKKKKE